MDGDMMKTAMALATVSLLLVVACTGQPEVPQAPAEETEDVGSGWTAVTAEELSATTST